MAHISQYCRIIASLTCGRDLDAPYRWDQFITRCDSDAREARKPAFIKGLIFKLQLEVRDAPRQGPLVPALKTQIENQPDPLKFQAET